MSTAALCFSRQGAFGILLLLTTACTQAPADVAAASATAAQATRPVASSSAQHADAATTHYAHDDPGQPGLALPAAIVRALGTDERVLSCAQGTRDGVSRFAPDWVAVRRVDLDQDGDADWIVNGRHPCLRDGDAVGWWVYADTGAAPRLLLPAAMATSLQVLASRTQGLRDLRLQRADGDVVARYDGVDYDDEVSPVAPH